MILEADATKTGLQTVRRCSLAQALKPFAVRRHKDSGTGVAETLRAVNVTLAP
ncbi:hypothetical protein C4K39_5351 [Pseudomonas sessilinigenes]|nr:hypothetical protein C4K39_5351 [Pseudomonas sessilinigenes]